jgi:hypothetical protein
MRALLSIPSQILQIRAQTGDRQELFCRDLPSWPTEITEILAAM